MNTATLVKLSVLLVGVIAASGLWAQKYEGHSEREQAAEDTGSYRAVTAAEYVADALNEAVIKSVDKEIEEPSKAEIIETDKTVQVTPTNLEERQAVGGITGQVFDKENAEPLRGVAIVILETDFGTITDAQGEYRFNDIPVGAYTLSFIKSGYLEANITDTKVITGEEKVLDFAMPPRPIEMSDDVYELQDFTVTAEEVNDMMMKLEIRMASSEALEVFSSEDFSKFVASDISDAVKRVTGVTIQKGGFAVIRGLDERYSSTLFNGAPLPSPDPEKQSVPLDLFPSEIVSNLIVSKTFTPGQPGNSTGGSILIQSATFPDELGFNADVSYKTGFNTNAEDAFYGNGGREKFDIDFNNLGSFSNEYIAENYNVLSGRLTPELENAKMDESIKLKLSSVMERTRLFASLSQSKKYRSVIGEEEKRKGLPGFVSFMGTVFNSGDLALGELTDTSGRYDTNASSFEDRTTFYFTAEQDIGSGGNHSIGFVGFKNAEDKIGGRSFSNGTFENFDPNRNGALDEGDILGTGLSGPGQFTSSFLSAFYGSNIIQQNYNDFLNSSLYKRSQYEESRELEVAQIYGKHLISGSEHSKIKTLEVNWLWSDSNTEQIESGAVNVAGFQLPDNNYITGGDTEGSINDFTTPSVSWRLTNESQEFRRMSFDINKESSLAWNLGFSTEESERESKQEYYPLSKSFVEYQDIGNTSQSYSTPEGASNHTSNSGSAWGDLSLAVDPAAKANSSREIVDYFISSTAQLFESIELKIGLQYEAISMETQTVPGVSGTNFFNSDILRKGTTYDSSSPAFANHQILGYDDALEIDFNEMIDENHLLPSVIFNYRPKEGIRLLAGYSETVTRPSFREFTFLTTQDPMTGDYFTGNPLLETSKAKNFDFRAELLNDNGDMLAAGLFLKNISKPLERTMLSGSDATSEILFNNPNDATVKGIEFEARKQLDFIQLPIFRHLTLGGNLALISSEVKVMDSIRAVHEEGFALAGTGPNPVMIGGDYFANANTGTADGFKTERALVNQPDWICNLYLSFEQPDWGTSATLSVFSQSEMLLTASFITQGKITPDRYMASFEDVNFSFTQEINDSLSFNFSVVNILDSTREIVYDKELFTDVLPERAFTVGRSFSVSLSSSF
ncbi:MAG: Uncharacterised protein [Opitutia bacterium UBA7350]|nr:MAG: Uncharacterised protein [Opitutae bacterium UBA7350]